MNKIFSSKQNNTCVEYQFWMLISLIITGICFTFHYSKKLKGGKRKRKRKVKTNQIINIMISEMPLPSQVWIHMNTISVNELLTWSHSTVNKGVLKLSKLTFRRSSLRSNTELQNFKKLNENNPSLHIRPRKRKSNVMVALSEIKPLFWTSIVNCVVPF